MSLKSGLMSQGLELLDLDFRITVNTNLTIVIKSQSQKLHQELFIVGSRGKLYRCRTLYSTSHFYNRFYKRNNYYRTFNVSIESYSHLRRTIDFGSYSVYMSRSTSGTTCVLGGHQHRRRLLLMSEPAQPDEKLVFGQCTI